MSGAYANHAQWAELWAPIVTGKGKVTNKLIYKIKAGDYRKINGNKAILTNNSIYKILIKRRKHVCCKILI